MTNSTTASTPSAVAPNVNREQKKGSISTLRGLLPFLAPYKRQFVMAGIALVVAACATLAIPAAFKQMIDLGFGGTGDKSIKHVDLVFLALFGVATVLALATAARFYTVSWLGERLTPISAAPSTSMSSPKAPSSSRPRRPAKCCRA